MRPHGKKLKVKRQTLRMLGPHALAEAAGGGALPLPKSNAWTGGNDDTGGGGDIDRSCTGG